MKLFIAEHSPMVCARLVTILSEIDGIVIAGFAHTVPQALPVIAASKPDVVLIGSHFPRNNATRLLRFIREHHPGTLAIMLTDHPSEFVESYTDSGPHLRFDKAMELEALVVILHQIAGVQAP